MIICLKCNTCEPLLLYLYDNMQGYVQICEYDFNKYFKHIILFNNKQLDRIQVSHLLQYIHELIQNELI